jgi:hypothetical protein
MIDIPPKRQDVKASFALWSIIVSLHLAILGTFPNIALCQEEKDKSLQEVFEVEQFKEREAFFFQTEQGAEPSQGQSGFDSFGDEVIEGLDFELRILGYETAQELSGSPINPGNILGIPDYSFVLDVHPDFYLDYRKLRLMAKPRSVFSWSRFEEGVLIATDEFEADVFLNEWLVGLQMTESLFVSIGRENLQWGPSNLISPSNIFFRENGLRNPKLEVRGQGFARTVWIPSNRWSVSGIANLSEGADETINDFEPAYALKIDYTGYRKFFSLIPSYREDDREYLGTYAGWRATDGFFFYAEGLFSEGTNALYPVDTGLKTPGGVSIISLEATEDDSGSLEIEALVGVSYTFELGPTLALEYFLNTAGYTDKQIEMVTDFTQLADFVLSFLPPNITQEFIDIDPLVDLNLSRLRKHYINLLYQHSLIRNVFSIGLRYTYNLDDNSSQLIPVVLYDLNDKVQLFLVGTQNFGPDDGEFRFFVDYSYFFGLQYTF